MQELHARKYRVQNSQMYLHNYISQKKKKKKARQLLAHYFICTLTILIKNIYKELSSTNSSFFCKWRNRKYSMSSNERATHLYIKLMKQYDVLRTCYMSFVYNFTWYVGTLASFNMVFIAIISMLPKVDMIETEYPNCIKDLAISSHSVLPAALGSIMLSSTANNRPTQSTIMVLARPAEDVIVIFHLIIWHRKLLAGTWISLVTSQLQLNRIGYIQLGSLWVCVCARVCFEP